MAPLILTQLDPKALGQRLQEARKGRGFTQQQIAEKLGVARTTLVAIEKGERRVTASELLAFCREYGRPATDFVRADAGRQPFLPQFRMVRGTEDEIEPALAAATQELERHARNYLEIECALNQPLPRNHPPTLDLDRVAGDVEQAAEDLAIRERNRLGFGDGPITNLRARLESEVGLRIFCFAMEPKIAGLFGYSDELGGCIALNSRHPAERRRWSLAHEYGHFLATRFRADINYLSQAGGKSSAERFVDHFAKHFLMPTSGLNRTFSEMRQAGKTLTLASICTLAAHYKVSFQALVLRLEELKRIKAGTWEGLVARRFSVGQARRSLGIEAANRTEECFSERYQVLALLAHEQSLLSEAELSEKLGQDRVTVREFVNVYRRRMFQEGDGTLQQLDLLLSTEVV